MAHLYKPEYQDCLNILAGNIGSKWSVVYLMFDEESLIANYTHLLSPLRRILHSRNKNLIIGNNKINTVPPRSAANPRPINEDALFEVVLLLNEYGLTPIRKIRAENPFRAACDHLTTVDLIREQTGQKHEALSSYVALQTLTSSSEQ